MVVKCPHCDETNAYTDEKRGKTVHCRACQKVFFVSYEGVAARNKESVNEKAMSELDNNAEGQEMKVSVLAVASFVLSIFFIPALMPFFAPVGEGALLLSVEVGGLFFALVAVILGIAALIQRLSGARSLWWLGIIGIAVPIAWAVFIYCWIVGVSTSWH
jgi:hypothetical protein